MGVVVVVDDVAVVTLAEDEEVSDQLEDEGKLVWFRLENEVDWVSITDIEVTVW